jgi:hypothetical protein
MKTSWISVGYVSALLSIGTIAFGQVPPTNDTSDANQNIGMGTGALQSNTTGTGNTASGDSALASNTTGVGNTASGVDALINNTTGPNNTAVGEITLYNNTTGFTNSAVGGYALFTNTTGAQNTALGGGALYSNTTGNNNVGVGVGAGGAITEGGQNVAIGLNAASNMTTGNGNIVIGAGAGTNLTTGNRNIDIGNDGIAGEAHTIRIGDARQTATFIAGVWGHIVKPGSPVFVGPDGSLGVVASSERYKTDIAPIGSVSERLSQLRPVTFHLKTDPSGDTQFGLIAEEVASVYPELVIRDDQGKIEGVRYDELAPILLSEVQQQEKLIATQAEQMSELRRQFVDLKETAAMLQRTVGELRETASGIAVH